MRLLSFVVLFLSLFCSALADKNDNDTAKIAIRNKKDTVKFVIHAWTLNRFFEKDTIPIDSLLDHLHILSTSFIKDHSYTWLGRLGQPLESNVFFNRVVENDFIFSSSLRPYHKDFRNNAFYTTNKPFTWFVYKSRGPVIRNQDQALKLIHTQNPTKDFNFGIDYDVYSSESSSRTLKGKNHAVTAFSSYNSKNYNVYGCFYYNMNNMIENGGFIHDSIVNYKTNTFDGLDVYLTQASSKTRLIGASIDQQFKLNRLGRVKVDSANIFAQTNAVNYFIDYSSFKRKYSDVAATSGNWNELYTHWYYNPEKTTDSTITRRLTNQLQLALPDLIKGVPSFYASLKHEFYYTHYNVPDTIRNYKASDSIGVQDKKTDFDLSVEFGMKNRATRLAWQLSGTSYLIGRRAGNYNLSGTIFTRFGKTVNAPFVKITGISELTRPSFYLDKYYSNHFIWNDSLKSQIKESLEFDFSIPKTGFNFNLKYAIIYRYIYFNDDAVPAQADSAAHVFEGSLSKKFKLWHIYSLQSIIYQKVLQNSDILHLPEIIYYTSTYWEQELHFFTGGKLLFQLGFDINYHTRFYNDAYMPATGIFYNQHKETWNYHPQVDAYLKFNLKSFNMVFEFTHVNAGYSDPVDFNALHYPMLERMFTIGISWLFDN